MRKWGVRFLKTLAVLTAILALVHIEEYWRGERAYNRAVAAWKAAGLPSAKEFFKDDPIVPTDKNLLDAPFYSACGNSLRKSASKKPDASLSKKWRCWATCDCYPAKLAWRLFRKRIGANFSFYRTGQEPPGPAIRPAESPTPKC